MKLSDLSQHDTEVIEALAKESLPTPLKLVINTQGHFGYNVPIQNRPEVLGEWLEKTLAKITEETNNVIARIAV